MKILTGTWGGFIIALSRADFMGVWVALHLKGLLAQLCALPCD